MNTNYPDSLLIAQYLEGKLDRKMMYELEKQALDDPFLWDALEGYEQSVNHGAELSILQRQLHERIVHLQENKKVYDFTWQRLSIAATASVLFIAAGILFWLNTSRSVTVADKQVNVSLIPQDSIINEISSYKYRSLDSKQQEAASSGKLKQSNNNKLSSTYSTEAEQGVQPVPGWDIYRQYLEDNMRRPDAEPKLNGSVLLSFKVDENGKTKEFRVLKGLNEAYNLEAIRLVKDGPLWKIPAEPKIITGRIEIVF